MTNADPGDLHAIRTELHALVARLETYIALHDQVHQVINREDHDGRLTRIENVMIEWEAYGKLLKMVFGTSLLGAVAGTLALLELIRTH